jgi:hypothetical protein
MHAPSFLAGSSAVSGVATKEQPSALLPVAARPQDTGWNGGRHRRGTAGSGQKQEGGKLSGSLHRGRTTPVVDGAVMALQSSSSTERPSFCPPSLFVRSSVHPALCALSLRALVYLCCASDRSCPLLPFLHVSVHVRRRPSRRRCRNDASWSHRTGTRTIQRCQHWLLVLPRRGSISDRLRGGQMARRWRQNPQQSHEGNKSAVVSRPDPFVTFTFEASQYWDEEAM